MLRKLDRQTPHKIQFAVSRLNSCYRGQMSREKIRRAALSQILLPPCPFGGVSECEECRTWWTIWSSWMGPYRWAGNCPFLMTSTSTCVPHQSQVHLTLHVPNVPIVPSTVLHRICLSFFYSQKILVQDKVAFENCFRLLGFVLKGGCGAK